MSDQLGGWRPSDTQLFDDADPYSTGWIALRDRADEFKGGTLTATSSMDGALLLYLLHHVSMGRASVAFKFNAVVRRPRDRTDGWQPCALAHASRCLHIPPNLIAATIEDCTVTFCARDGAHFFVKEARTAAAAQRDELVSIFEQASP